MSQEYAGQDPLKLAQQAERDLNTQAKKQALSKGASDSSMILPHHPHRPPPALSLLLQS